MSGQPLKRASHYVGRWLRAESRPDLGLGYCKGVRDGKLVFSYVDVPDVAEHEILVSRQDVIHKPIPIGTRVWVRGDPYGWFAGVIVAARTAHRYDVSLVADARRLPLYQDQFKVRWSRPLDNPALAIFEDAWPLLHAEASIQDLVVAVASSSSR